jgi:hypothetical protein
MSKEVTARFILVLDHLERICELEVELGILAPLNTKGRKQSTIEGLFKSLGQEAFLFQRKHSGEKVEEVEKGVDTEPIVVGNVAAFVAKPAARPSVIRKV